MNINDLLSDASVERLMALSTEDLKRELVPYIPAARQSVLPEEKVKKQGVQMGLAKAMMDANRELLDQLKKARQGL